MDFLKDERFKGIEKFERKVWLSSPTMHGDEQRWVDDAIQTNWVSTVGANINEVERLMAEYVGVKYAVGLSCTKSSPIGDDLVQKTGRAEALPIKLILQFLP